MPEPYLTVLSATEACASLEELLCQLVSSHFTHDLCSGARGLLAHQIPAAVCKLRLKASQR